MKISIVTTSALLWSFLFVSSIKAQHNTYYIGHSGFGWDLIVGEMVNDLASDAGINSYGYGYQFIGGTCLNNQWFSHDNPQGGTDSWVELGSGAYDIAILAEQIPITEVLLGSSFCHVNVLTSYEALDNFYDLAVSANPSTRIYLMEFHNEINQNVSDPFTEWVQMNAETRPVWEHLADSVSMINQGINIGIVPVAAAYQALADSIRSGVFPGITNWLEIFDPSDLPEATIHPTEMMYYLAACVHFAVIFNQSPEGLINETFATAGWQFDPPTADQALMMQQIAWEIVSRDPYALPQTLPLGVDDHLDLEVKVFPNPTKGNVSIRLANKPFYNGQFRILDLNGKECFKIKNLKGNEVNLELNLPSGMYIYEVSQTNNNLKNVIIGRVVIQ